MWSGWKPGPPISKGHGEITQRDLVRNALRMRPERIILGEVRQAEALDMLQAMNTGHDGSLATIHANTPRDALVRLETMVSMAGLNIPDKALRHQVASAIHAVIQVARLKDGSRKMLYLNEIVGMEGDVIVMQEIFNFEMQGIDRRGKSERTLSDHRHPAQIYGPIGSSGRSNSPIRCSGRTSISFDGLPDLSLTLSLATFHTYCQKFVLYPSPSRRRGRVKVHKILLLAMTI